MLRSISLGTPGTEMTKTLSEMFGTAKCMDWEGAPVYSIYELDPAPDGVIVEFLHARDDPVQGLSLSVAGGALVIDDAQGRSVDIWTDAAPARVSVRVKPKRRTRAVLKFWNSWLDTYG